jgi:hypothetical protein
MPPAATATRSLLALGKLKVLSTLSTESATGPFWSAEV